MKIKKIGIDFHGVINQDPAFFQALTTAAVEQGIEVHIVSGGPRRHIERYAEKYGIRYHKIWCIFDFYKHKELIQFLPDGSFHMDDELWNKAKADYCRQEEIALHIDDSNVYGDYFTSPYCLYNPTDKSCTINGKTIAMQGSASEVLTRLTES